MSAVSPTRPSRRAAVGRRKIVDESDEEDHTPESVNNDSEEEFTPAPSKSTRTTRRKTVDDTMTPHAAIRVRGSRMRESVEPSQIFSPPESEAPEPPSPTKKASPRKRTAGRQSVRANRKSRMSMVPQTKSIPEEHASLPTPQRSMSPDPENTENEPSEIGPDTSLKPSLSPSSPRASQRNATPLADITESTVNEQTPVAVEKRPEILKVNSQVTALEKPMDIVVRTRQAALPKVEEQSGPKSRIVITYLRLSSREGHSKTILAVTTSTARRPITLQSLLSCVRRVLISIINGS